MAKEQIEVDITTLCEHVDGMYEDMRHFVFIMQVCEARISAIEAALKKAGIRVDGPSGPTIQ